MVSQTRVFNGKRYILRGSPRSKVRADFLTKQLRNNGWKVRIVPAAKTRMGHNQWAVYARK